MNSNANNADGRFDGHRLAMVATLMDNFVRQENLGLKQENDQLVEAINARNRYIAELQDDFHRLMRWAEVQRNSLVEFAAVVEILQDRLRHFEPDAPFQYLVAQDEHRIFHAVRVDAEHMALHTPPDVIDLTTDTELDTDTE